MSKKYVLLSFLFLSLSLTVAAQSSRSDSIALSNQLYDQGVVLFQDKDYKKAATTFEQLRPIDEQLYDSLDQRHFYAADWLAACYGKMGETTKAREMSNDFELPPVVRWGREVIDSLSSLAMHYLEAGNFDEALTQVREVVRMEKDWNGEKSTTYATALNFLAYVLNTKGDMQQAEQVCRQSLEILSRHLKKNSYTFAVYHYTLVEALVGMQRYDEALNIIKRLEPIYEKYGDDKSKDFLSLLFVKMYAQYWMGDADGIEDTAKKIVSGCEKANLTNHYMYGTATGMMGEMACARGDNLRAVELLERTDSLFGKYENADPSLHPHYLSLLAQLQAGMGHYLEAKKNADKGLDLCKGQMVGSPAYNQLLIVKGAAALNLDDKYRGLTWIDQAIEGYRKNGQVDNLLVDGLGVMSAYYRSVNNHQKDLEYSRILLDTYLAMPDVEDSLVLYSMINMANSLMAFNEMDSAKVMTQRMVDFAEKRLRGTTYLGYAYFSAAQQLIYMAMLDQGLDDAQKAVEVYRELGEEKNMYSAMAMQAMAYAAKNDYVNAVDLQSKVVDYCRRHFDANSQEYLDATQSMAAYQMNLGNVQEGQRLMEETFYSSEYHQKEENTSAEERMQLGMQFFAMGQMKEAEVVYLQAMDLLREDSMLHTAQYASALYGLAQAEAGQQKWMEALGHADTGLSIMEGIFGREKAMLNSAQLYSLRGQLLLNLGRTTEGFEQLQEVERTIAPYVDEENMAHLQAGWNVCNAAIMDNRPEVAVDYAERLSMLLRNYILSKFTTMSAAERMGTWNQNAAFYDLVLPYMADRYKDKETLAPRIADCAYDGQLLSKGLLLTTEIEMNRLLLESGDDKAIQTFNEIKRQRTLLDQQVALPKEQRNIDADSLRQVINRLERQLTAMSTTYGDYTRPLRTTWQQVRDRLAPDDVAIEFVFFYPQREDSLQIPYLGALVLKHDMPHPEMRLLCDDWQLRVISTDGCYSSDSLSNLIWKPLAQYLEGAKRVYFSPAGALHDLAVEYAPVKDNKTFSECYDTYRLSSTREIVTSSPSKRMESARLFGGLQYNAKMEEVGAANRDEGLNVDASMMANRAPVDSLLLRGGAGYLAYTLKEVEDIGRQLKGKIDDVRTLVGVQGTEEAFKNLSGHPADILHVATHGFFWTDEQVGRMANLSFLQVANSETSSAEDKALSRSGLLFAGANAALTRKPIPDNMEDGVLTARELAQMDLRGTSLVVLSACQTALGTVTGEGVFGLQRGFKKAGVKTIVMSLWKVDDQATQVLMSAFYRHLAEGQSMRQAFTEAQSHLRQVENGRFNEPLYWAAFILLDAVE